MMALFKYERDGVAKIEELENTKLKLQARLAECEGTVENLVNLQKYVQPYVITQHFFIATRYLV